MPLKKQVAPIRFSRGVSFHTGSGVPERNEMNGCLWMLAALPRGCRIDANRDSKGRGKANFDSFLPSTDSMKQPVEWPTTRVTLLAQIRDASDRDAWREFVDLYAPLVYSYSRNRGLQHADAQNVSQEVFSRVSRAIRSFEYDAQRGQFRSWLGLITHQQMLRHQQRESQAARGVGAGECNDVLDGIPSEVEGAWSEAFNAHIYARSVEAVRAQSDPLEWQVFERIWDRNERPSDVARDLQKQPQWVYQVKFKIVGQLKEEIERLASDVAIFYRR